MTGIFLDAPEVAGKWLQIVREAIPKTNKVVLLQDLQDQTQLKSAENAGAMSEFRRQGTASTNPPNSVLRSRGPQTPKVDAMLVHSSHVSVDQAASSPRRESITGLELTIFGY